MDLVIDKLDDNLKLREFAARHQIPAVSDIGSSKLKYLVTERNEQFLFKDLRRKKSHFFSLDLKFNIHFFHLHTPLEIEYY